MEVVMRACDRITVLNYGKKLADGSPADIRDHSGVIEAYLGTKTSTREPTPARALRPPMLRIENLHVEYAQIPALRGVDMDINTGEIVALIGANGAGKSTTLKAISGLIEPSAGTIEFAGRSLGRSRPGTARGTWNNSCA